MAEPLFQINQVSKVYEGLPQVTALKDISLQIDAQEFVVILGPSGCGKTTLLRLLAGLDYPSQGECLYRGVSVARPSLEICYLFQEPRLFPWLTVAQNIQLSGQTSDLTDLAKRMGLADFLSSYPYQLSGGMAKRASLARALFANPQVVLLDEPLANLDLPTKIGLQKELCAIWQMGITCVMVTHDVDEALALASRLILLTSRPGKIIYDERINLAHPRMVDDQFLQWKQKITEWIMEGSVNENKIGET